jgi:glutamine amidotransferase
MTDRVTIVDYGSGNLLSVRRAFEHCGAEVQLAHDAASIAAAERLVLPGVGAFADGMAGLRERGLVQPIRDFAASGRPLLGICLGMQMLAGQSEEFGRHEGLGLIPGHVVPVPAADADGTPQKIPHIGWAELLPWREGAWAGTLMQGCSPGTAMYLVHSFHLAPERDSHGLAVCLYGGHRITAMVRSANVVGCQFHPEKSGPVGLALLARFLDLAPLPA